MSNVTDITGQTFGRLTALYRVGTKIYPSGGRVSIWHCKCICGNEINVNLSALKSGNTKSCGCLHVELTKSLNYKHGESHSRLNEVWKQMKKRCKNPNAKEYKFYGAKGVSVCKEWDKSFEVFKEWMMENGYDDRAERGACTIDRINPFGNYEPSNCRIVSMDIQLRNMRRNQCADNDRYERKTACN